MTQKCLDWYSNQLDQFSRKKDEVVEEEEAEETVDLEKVCRSRFDFVETILTSILFVAEEIGVFRWSDRPASVRSPLAHRPF